MASPRENKTHLSTKQNAKMSCSSEKIKTTEILNRDISGIIS